MRSLRRSHARDTLALLKTGIAYWMRLAPAARCELRCWRYRAQAIPDPQLRRASLEKLSGEALNSEAAAFFAITAPPRNRPRLIELVVAYQVMYDYLDAVNEEPASSQLLDGRRLHQALVHALQADAEKLDYYTYHPRCDDGAYLHSLIDACNSIFAALPSNAATAEPLIQAAMLCREAQARNHAVTADGYQQLIGWSEALVPAGPYRWWELAAAGISCLAIHALLAAAATPGTAREEAEQIGAAYFPSVTAISALLDSLVDREHDISTGNHSFVAHYDTSAAASNRYTAIIAEAMEGLGRLPKKQAHRIILVGIVGYYISAVRAGDALCEGIALDARKSLRPTIQPILAVMRARRYRHERRQRCTHSPR